MNTALSNPKPLLDVAQSLTGRRWVGPSVGQLRATEHLGQQTGLPMAMCAVLSRLGVQADDVDRYLSPTLRELLPDPRQLKDMERAAQRIADAATISDRIAIFADYDVDGGSSAALLITWLKHFGKSATLYVPDRVDEGYGPNVPAMQALAKDHALIICVDCGTLSHEAIAAATGADVIILDHHLGGETLPQALAVVNPNRQDEEGSLAHLCAAAVVFLTLVETNRHLRARNQNTPELLGLLDLVALATVADVAPLTGVNRAFVRQGLTIMGRRARPGLVALADTARLDTAPAAYHLGYVLGPRINAGGRVGQADLGARLLSTADPHEADALAERLETLNTERREIEAAVLATAFEQAETRGFDAPLVWAAGEGWHPGVVGIVAARLKEAANRPAIVIGLENGVGKGSGRSISGIDLGAPIQRLAMEGTITKGGGHKMAAGLTVEEQAIPAAMERLGMLLNQQGAGARGAADLRLDGVVMPEAVSVDLLNQIDSVGPFGAGAPGPRFAMPDMHIFHARRVGESHLKVSFGTLDGRRMDGIAFGAFSNSTLGPSLESAQGSRAHFAGRLDLNVFRGRTSVQMIIEDAAIPE